MALARCDSHTFHDPPGLCGEAPDPSTGQLEATWLNTSPTTSTKGYNNEAAKLGDLTVSRIGLGAMGMSFAFTGAGSDDAESIRTIHRALELGVNFIDTAEVYGPYINEELVGRAIKGRRDEVVLATKFGMISHAGGGPGRTRQQPGQHPHRR